MKNSQIYNALRSLTQNEFHEFGKFINSPYFNNRSEVIRFYDAVKKHYPDFNIKKVNEEMIFSKIYPKKIFNDVLLRKVFSLTTNLVADFLAISSFKENELEYNVKIADKLREKKLSVMFEKRSKIIESLFDTFPHTFAYYESKFNFTTLKNGYFLHTDEGKMIKGFQKEIDDFMEYFLSVSLLLYIRLSEWSKARSIKFDLKFYDEVLNHIKKYDYNNNPLINLYYNMLMLLNTEEEKYFYELQQGRKNFENKLSPGDDYNAVITLMQYCYKKVQKGDSDFRRRQFEMVNIVLDKNMLPPGNIEPYFFINSVRNAAFIREFEWCTNFIEKYKSQLNKERLSETVSFSNALLEFYKGNYDTALNCISAFNTERSTIKTEFRNIQLIIYYELNFTDMLYSLIDSYKHFLSRDKDIAEKTKEMCSDFIKMFVKLEKIKHDENSEAAILLKNEVEKKPYFNMKEWFFLKLDEIIKKSRK